MEEEIQIQFLGGAGTVTGSKTLISYKDSKVLIDCGLFQGLKELRLLNWKDIPVDESTIDAIILTHAHLDHCGYIPLIFKNGFSGMVHCTHPTAELTEIILKDSAKIQEEDAERAGRHSYSKHKNPKPLYTQKDVKRCLGSFEKHNYEEWVIITNDIKFRLLNAGHILGSAMVELKVGPKTFLFTGDIGRKDPMLLYPPKKVEQADYVILESTYGDRQHRIENTEELIRDIVNETYNRGGILMIPSFAVERTQELIYILYQLREKGEIGNIPVYLDSPMGIRSSYVFDRYPEWQDISKKDAQLMFEWVDFIMDPELSRVIVRDKKPKIVLAGSGMLEGGRILHYLDAQMNNPKNTLLFVGFQAVGTRGRSIEEGSQEIKFFGEYHHIGCEVRSISSMSAHADQEEIFDWMSGFDQNPSKVFLNHGEPHQSNALRVLLETKLGCNVEVPSLNQVYYIDDKDH